MIPSAVLAAALFVAAPAAAQAQQAAAVDPARLTAASTLVDVIMPPSERMAMLESVLKPMYANVRQSMLGNERFAALFQNNAEAMKALEAFMVRQESRSIGTLRQTLPEMVEAMKRAYARRFTVAQIDEMTAFFRTPTGQVYIRQAATIMTDPDMQAWQRQIMNASLRDIQNDVGGLVQQLSALEAKK